MAPAGIKELPFLAFISDQGEHYLAWASDYYETELGMDAVAEVKLDGLTGNLAKDSAKANAAVGFDSTPEGYVWHHIEDGKTMQLIPRELHNFVRHTGGTAVIRNGGFDSK